VLGSIGGVITPNNTGKFAAKYPALYAMVKSIHEKRLESNLAHAMTRSTGRPTGPIKYTYYSKHGIPLVKRAFLELATKW
jgi:hypothetical protein